jgi:hypothetical protein
MYQTGLQYELLSYSTENIAPAIFIMYSPCYVQDETGFNHYCANEISY